MINIAIMGYGTIGSGVAEILNMNGELIAGRAGQEIQVKYILDLREFPGDPLEDKVVHDVNIIVNDPEVSIVVETMGGERPAYDFVRSMLEAGKSVVTSNKALVAVYGAELMETAKENGVNFFFEASVGGGIPIIRPLKNSLTPDVIEEISGILNGTTNYILTKMNQEGLGFEEALKQAQDKGFAERDPSADIQGGDAARKIAILTSMACGKNVDYRDFPVEGITNISAQDYAYAGKENRTIKLLGTSRISGEDITVRVAPAMIGPDNPLYGVSGVYNGIMVKGNAVGRLMFYGSGAGKLPTAAAVVADIMKAVTSKGRYVTGYWTKDRQELTDPSAEWNEFFVRLSSGIASDLAEKHFKVRKLVTDVVEGEYAVYTEKMTEKELAEAIETVGGCINVIRLAD